MHRFHIGMSSFALIKYILEMCVPTFDLHILLPILCNQFLALSMHVVMCNHSHVLTTLYVAE